MKNLNNIYPLTRICVTKKDIAYGHKKSASCCPIALAFKRRGLEVTVGPSSLTIYGDDACRAIDLPPKAKSFVYIFDSGYGKAYPFSFDIDLTSGTKLF